MRARIFAVFSTLALVLVPAVVGAMTATRPVRPADLFGLKDIGELQVSPDGRTVALTVITTNLAANRVLSQLMTIGSGGGTPAPVPGVPDNPSSLRWAPTGARLAFIAADSGGSAIWVWDVASGRGARVCSYSRGNSFQSKAGNALAWSPDGARLAFVGTTDPSPPPQDPLVISRLQYKTRTAFSDNRPSHIFVVPVAGSAPRPVTSGPFDEHSIAWGGDGREIVFLSNRESDPDVRLNYDIFAVNVEAGSIRRLTATPGVEFEPQVSPDGRWIAFMATTRPVTTIDSIAEDTHLWVMPAGGGTARELNGALDRRSSAPLWTPDSRRIVYLAADHGKTLVMEVTSDGRESRVLVDRPAQVSLLTMARDGSLVLALSDAATPHEVFRLRRPGGDLQPLTQLNRDVAAGWTLVAPESVTFRSVDGITIEGWFYRASVPGRRVPMLLTIHGGPHGAFGYGFNGGAQVNASRGYATLAINPRGSTGYGQAFTDGCVGNWGGGDYSDLMAGVDYMLKTHPDIDPDRLGVTGGSYGGFMTNWIITQTHRFKAAVAVASLSNLTSFYATSLYQDLVHAEFNGFPWSGDNFSRLWQWSPLAHVAGVTTPTLFIHGEQDNDVHITQAEEMYTALRRQGVDAVLARYPREGHGFREPQHSLDRMIRTLDWFDRYLAPATPHRKRSDG